MQAIAYKQYGGPAVLHLTEVPKPTPKTGEVLIRVHATTVTAADIMMRKGKPWIGRQMIWTAIGGGKKAKSFSTGLLPVKERLTYFLAIKELLKTGKIKTVTDWHYPLSSMGEAHQYVKGGHKKGNLVVRVEAPD
jgi:NADPH:quinone reductase-like Zn-dependent oxidoreductase